MERPTATTISPQPTTGTIGYKPLAPTLGMNIEKPAAIPYDKHENCVNRMFWIVFAILGLGLAIALIILFLNRNKSNPNNNASTEASEQQNNSDNAPKGANNFYTVNQNDFQKLLASKQPFIVFFYADWCGICHHVLPQFQKAATLAHIPFVAIEEKQIPQNLPGIPENSGFPTIGAYVHGIQFVSYHGNRSEQSFVAFASRFSPSMMRAQ